MLFLKSLLAVVLLGASSLFVVQDEEALRSGSYSVDPMHSTVIFRVNHLGVSNFYGRFNQVSGSLEIDAEDASKDSVSVRIAADSVDTNDGNRNQHAMSPDFLNAKEFPALSFESSSVEDGGNGMLHITGELNMHGVTHEVSFDAQHVGHGEIGRFGYRAGYEAELNLKRSDYGMDFMIGLLGDEIRFTISLEAMLN